VSVWALLEDAIASASVERPKNSVTPAEFAERTGLSVSRAHEVLKRNPALQPVRYRNPLGAPGVCYVPKER
jgi:hypothetical protein